MAKKHGNGISTEVHEDGSIVTLGVLLPNGVGLKLRVSKDGYMALDHARTGSGSSMEDERRILEAVLSPRKRAFNVYSSSGYHNSYKGKPLDPTSAAPAAGAKAAKSKSSPSTAAAATPTESASTAAPATSPSSSAPGPLKPSDLSVGDMVARDGGDTGKVVSVNKDTIGWYVEVEWSDHGTESMYAEELKSEKVTLVAIHKPDPTSGSKKPDTSTPSVTDTSESSEGDGSPAASSTPSPKRKARKKTTAKKKPVAKATHTHDLDALVADLTARS